MKEEPGVVTLSRGRQIRLTSPNYYEDLLTGIASGILHELAELEKLDLARLPQSDFEEVVAITHIRLLNELYYCLGQLRSLGLEIEPKQAIQDLRDIWNRYIDATQSPQALKFHTEPQEQPLQ